MSGPVMSHHVGEKAAEAVSRAERDNVTQREMTRDDAHKRQFPNWKADLVARGRVLRQRGDVTSGKSAASDREGLVCDWSMVGSWLGMAR